MKFWLPLIFLTFSSPATAQADLQKLLPSDPDNFAGFGNAVDLDGDVAAVGSSTKSVGGLNYAGGVYVYRKQGPGPFVEEARLLRPVPEIHDNFGTSVAIDGNVMVAGAPDFPYSSFTGIGAAYVYRYAGGVWQQEAELHGSTAHVDSGFGRDVAIDGNRILVGANLNSGGACYVFEDHGLGWIQTAVIQPPSGSFHFDQFASALALQGDLALIGAARHMVGSHINAGKAFVYRYVGGIWQLDAELLAPFPDDNEYFGAAVALDGDVAVVGSPDDDSICVYRDSGSGWPFELRFKNAGLGVDHGDAVAIEGNLILGGTPQSSFFETYGGAVYPYREDNGTWLEDPPFFSEDSGRFGGFGSAIAINGGLVLASSGHDEPGYIGLGCVYVMDPTPGLVLEINPQPAESGEDLDLRVRYGAPNAPTYIAVSFVGTATIYVAPLDVELGLRNPSPLLGPSNTNGQGEVDWSLPLPLSAAGRDVWFQAVQYQNASNVVPTTVI